MLTEQAGVIWMVRKEGTWPANARIDVDYSKGKKPKIKFSYPKLPASKRKGKKWSTAKEDAENQNTLGIHTLIILLVICTLFSGVYFTYFYEDSNYPENCTVELREEHIEIETTARNFMTGKNATSSDRLDMVHGMDVYCDNGIYGLYFNRYPDVFGITKPNFMMDSNPIEVFTSLLYVIAWTIVFIWVFAIANRVVTKILIKMSWYQKWLPEHNAKKRFKKYQKFTAKDFDTEAGCFVEVPNFKNISIEYKTFGDFSPKLKKIKIREHRYYKYDTKKKEIGKLKVEILKWTARFYFDSVPKNGYLEVIYY